MSVGVGYELLGTVVNPLGFQIGGDIQLKNVNLKKAPITPKIPVIKAAPMSPRQPYNSFLLF